MKCTSVQPCERKRIIGTLIPFDLSAVHGYQAAKESGKKGGRKKKLSAIKRATLHGR